jgi:hypothetical protein
MHRSAKVLFHNTSLLFSSEELMDHVKKGHFKSSREERLQRDISSTWSLYIGSFWTTHFINPPEVRGQVVRLYI